MDLSKEVGPLVLYPPFWGQKGHFRGENRREKTSVLFVSRLLAWPDSGSLVPARMQKGPPLL